MKHFLQPVILCGGMGIRLGSLSTPDMPKPFIPLIDGKSLAELTIERLQNQNLPDPIFICGEKHIRHIQKLVKDYSLSNSQILAEPCPRNTGPAIACALSYMSQRDPNTHALIMPADHWMDSAHIFINAARSSTNIRDKIICFGKKPDRAEPDYGHIKAEQNGTVPPYRIIEFTEKPDISTAQRYCDSGNYLWNMGIFQMDAAFGMELIARHIPTITQRCKSALAKAQKELNVIHLSKTEFEKCDNISFDYAVMEHIIGESLVYPLDIAWDDLGSPERLARYADNEQRTDITS